MADRTKLEVCVDSIESAIAADRGGADRIELCSCLAEGGVTPSPGVTATVLNQVALGVFVMIRPRAGDFCYSSAEFTAMEQDILAAKQRGANGVVFGILLEDGRIDVARTQLLIEIARPLQVTFHRAFDMSRDLSESLEDLVRAGVDRVLTSGGEQNVDLGRSKIADLNRQAGDRIVVMPGGGISEKNVCQLLSDVGVREIQASLRTAVPSPMNHRNERLSMTTIQGRDYQRFVVLEGRVRAFLALLSSSDSGSDR